MLYGTPQAGDNADLGKNLTCVIPADSYTLFDGSETAADELRSVAFVRGPSPSMMDAGMTFQVTGAAATTTVSIDGSNTDDPDLYVSVSGDLVPDANGNVGYWEQGRFAFYTARISALGEGDPMPVVTVQR